MVFSGRSHPELAERIAEQLGVELGEVTLETFANGETYCRYDESIRGSDLFIVQTGCEPIDQNLMELLQMIQAAKLGSAKRITAVIPLFPYARQDRKAKPREPITARLVADLLQVAGADRILTMDLHAGQIQGFFTIPVDHMTALPLFARHFRDLGLSRRGRRLGLARHGPRQAGRALRRDDRGRVRDHAQVPPRPRRASASVTEIAGRVKGKRAIIGDDVIMTGRTMMANVRALKEHGASEVWLFATHGVFCGDTLEKFAASDAIKGIVVTDTVPIDPLARPDKLTVLPVSQPARRDDHERVRRRLRLGDLRRREPALLSLGRHRVGLLTRRSADAVSAGNRRRSPYPSDSVGRSGSPGDRPSDEDSECNPGGTRPWALGARPGEPRQVRTQASSRATASSAPAAPSVSGHYAMADG